MSGEGGWDLTESDPGLFSSLLWDLGVKGVQVEELVSLDASLLEHLKPIHAFIFLFKHVNDAPSGPYATPEGSWFALQTITNACATLALLNSVMNLAGEVDATAPPVELGEELSNLHAFTAELGDPELRGAVLNNSDRLREGASAGSKLCAHRAQCTTASRARTRSRSTSSRSTTRRRTRFTSSPT